MEEALFIREDPEVVYIKARGHMTAALCPELKERVIARLESPPPLQRIYLDLRDCEYMDSTFMGLIVGFNKRLQRSASRAITLLHVNDTCMGLLKTIGIVRLVELSDSEIPFPAPMENLAGAGKATAGFILDAHENLMELSDDNRKRFTTLYQVLKSQLDRGSGGDKG
ncbi:MAG: STAS domain-containing protein [Spirochaetales bacterium]|nr:STAS domain-containing protein [Spirochaetales bacterium]